MRSGPWPWVGAPALHLALAAILLVGTVPGSAEARLTSHGAPPAEHGTPGHVDFPGRSSTLAESSASVPEGEPVTFWLNLTAPNCDSGSGANLSVEFDMGDGLRLFFSGLNLSFECPAPGVMEIALNSSYHNVGSFEVQTLAQGTQDSAALTNSVQVHVTTSSQAASDLAWEWTVGLSLIIAAGLGVVVVWRRFSRRPPELQLWKV